MSAANYGWIITGDHINTSPDDKDINRVGTMGPSDISESAVEALKAGQGDAFKMYDDDGNLYYSGRYVGPDGEERFGPLDDFGGPDAGAVTIKYRNPVNGKWEVI
jgi:hypothetical protein